MKRALLALSASVIFSGLGIVNGPAQASDWGCKVLLCLANPGSPTEYAECVKPINDLYSHLAKGGSFPTCSGAGFSSTKPRFERYECQPGYNLVQVPSKTSHGAKATCQATAFTELNGTQCLNNKGFKAEGEWFDVGGKRICGYYEQKKPLVRDRPHYVDVTIEGGGTKRVWY